MDAVAVRKAVHDLLGRKGDDTIREYIIAVLELGDYDFGRNGEQAYEHFGQMLVLHHACHKCCRGHSLAIAICSTLCLDFTQML